MDGEALSVLDESSDRRRMGALPLDPEADGGRRASATARSPGGSVMRSKTSPLSDLNESSSATETFATALCKRWITWRRRRACRKTCSIATMGQGVPPEAARSGEVRRRATRP
jgi:hypothetical protein